MLKCRLCGGDTLDRERLHVLGVHDVRYLCCESCGSLQTEPPYWLDDAYRQEGTGDDTGACQRSLDLTLQTATLLRLIQWEPEAKCLDYGAGMGLFARMMRDRGYNFFAYDKYQSPYYMDRYVAPSPDVLRPQLVTVYEVLEHLPDPAKDLDDIFGLGADIVLATTELCDGQGLDWWYINPKQGQHVFFYSRTAMILIADRYRYRYDLVRNLHIFSRPHCRLDAALDIVRDDRQFGQLMLGDFLKHQSAPYTFAAKDSLERAP